MKARRAVCPICGGVIAAPSCEVASTWGWIAEDEMMKGYRARGFAIEDCEPGEARVTGCQCEERLVAERTRARDSRKRNEAVEAVRQAKKKGGEA
jgi:hypothetical protein